MATFGFHEAFCLGFLSGIGWLRSFAGRRDIGDDDGRRKNKCSMGLRKNWRRERDSNPRRAYDPYTLSRGAPSTTRPSLRALGNAGVSARRRLPGWPACGAAMILKGPARGKALAAIRDSGAEPRAHELLHRLERRIERLGIATAGLRKIRPTSAASAHLRRHRTGQLGGLGAGGQIRGQ